MNGEERIKECEQVGWMPHPPHFFKDDPTQPGDQWECPGYEREAK